MTNENLEETTGEKIEKIEISLSLTHKNGTRWAVEEISKVGRTGLDYNFAELKKQLSAIQGPVKLEEPVVVRHYNELKVLVEEHNKKYENKFPEQNEM